MESGENQPIQEKAPNQERLKIDCFSSTQASENNPFHNEDTIFFGKDRVGVLDGMDGIKDGQWNAEMSSQIIQAYLLKHSRPRVEDAIEILTNATNLASNAINKENQGKGGTTATYGILCQTTDGVDQIAIASVGDSRAYLFHEGKLTKLTVDDNMTRLDDPSIQEELDNAKREGDLSRQAKRHVESNHLITNFIGSTTEISPEVVIQPIIPGDILIFTTDGIHDNLTTTEISQIISQNSKNQELLPDKLTNASLLRSKEGSFRSKSDDMTALVAVVSKDKGAIVSQPEVVTASTEFVPILGQKITLQRTSGHIEGGWEINDIDEDYLTVTKRDPVGKEMQKTVLKGDVERFNRPTSTNDIPTSEDFDQLEHTIKMLGGVQGSSDFFSVDIILSFIEDVIKNKGSEESLKKLTMNYDLRNTVRRIYESQKKDNQ